MRVIGYIRVSTKTQLRKGQGIRIYHERIDEEMTECDIYNSRDNVLSPITGRFTLTNRSMSLVRMGSFDLSARR